MQLKSIDRWQKRELQVFRNQNPLSILFKFGGSVMDKLLAEYLALLIICFTLSFMIGLQVPNNKGLVAFLKKLTAILDTFPGEIIIFPLSFCMSQIYSQRDSLFRNGIIFTDDFAFFLVVNKFKNKKTIFKWATIMISNTFSYMDSNVSLVKLNLDQQLLLNFAASNRSLQTDPYWIAGEMLKVCADDTEKEKLYPKILELIKASTTLTNLVYTRLTYVSVSTLMICCNIYMVHIILDCVTNTVIGHYVSSYLEVTIKFIIFYGWPKSGLLEYYPFGTTTEQYNLNNIAKRNMSVGNVIVRYNL